MFFTTVCAYMMTSSWIVYRVRPQSVLSIFRIHISWMMSDNSFNEPSKNFWDNMMLYRKNSMRMLGPWHIENKQKIKIIRNWTFLGVEVFQPVAWVIPTRSWPNIACLLMIQLTTVIIGRILQRCSFLSMYNSWDHLQGSEWPVLILKLLVVFI